MRDRDPRHVNDVHEPTAAHAAGLLKVQLSGRVGWNASNMPVLELTTTGRKSGQPRSVMLTSPRAGGFDDRDRGVAGSATIIIPAWFLNLRDDPDVEVTMKGERRPMRARVADADERARSVATRHRRITRITPATRPRPTARSPSCFIDADADADGDPPELAQIGCSDAPIGVQVAAVRRLESGTARRFAASTS